jgi:hypothetical protein
MMGGVSLQTGGRIAAVHVAEARLPADMAELVTAAKLDLSTSQTSQLQLTFADPQLALVAGGYLPKRTQVSYAGLALEVAVREIVTVSGGANAGAPGLQVTCRATAVQRLKRRIGPRVWAGLSYTQWLHSEATAVGARFVGQPSAQQPHVIRKADKGSPAESSWDTASRGAGELGFIVFEAAGAVYFGRPSWLVATQPRHVVHWAGGGQAGTDPYLLAVPSVRDSDDDRSNGLTGSLSANIALAETLPPGHSLTLTGLGPFSAAPFLITDLGVDLLNPAAVDTVSFATPVDPAPQPVTAK